MAQPVDSPASPADLIRKRARFDLVRLERATAFLRGGRTDHPERRRPKSGGAAWAKRQAEETHARRELIAASEHWHVLDRLTPRQMTVLCLIGVEGNSSRVAARLNLSPQTVKNHVTSARKAVYGDEYLDRLDEGTSLSPLIALAVRWALDYEERTRPTGDSGEREQG